MKIFEQKIKECQEVIAIAKGLEDKEVELQKLQDDFKDLTFSIMSFGEFHIDLYNTNMDDATKCLKRLAKLGYHIKGEPQNRPSIKGKIWTLTNGAQFWARFSDGVVGPGCKYVQVDVKVEPVFELQCEGE